MKSYFYNMKTGVLRLRMGLTEDRKYDVPDRENWVTITLKDEQVAAFIADGIITREN